MNRTRYVLVAAFGLSLLGAAGCGSLNLSRLGGHEHHAETYLDSDDYHDGDEIVGRFLNDADYGLMVEDVERHDTELDWTWVELAEGSTLKHPTELGFNLSKYGKVRVLPVKNESLKVAPGVETAVRDAFVQAVGLLGLTVAGDGEPAPLELGVAVVDYKADKTYAYVAMIDPFIELEGRLRDTRTGKTLYLFRTQENGTTPAVAAADIASDVARFLR